MNKECRIIITKDCNLNCSCCCNELPEQTSQFKKERFQNILEKGYDVYKLTGGEPTLNPKSLMFYLGKIKTYNPHAKTYVYTNGYNMNILRALAHLIDGISLSFHDTSDLKDIEYKLDSGFPTDKIRVMVQDTKMNDELKQLLDFYDVTKICLWEMNKCDIITEDRYILE